MSKIWDIRDKAPVRVPMTKTGFEEMELVEQQRYVRLVRTAKVIVAILEDYPWRQSRRPEGMEG